MIPTYSPAALRDLLRRHQLTGSACARMTFVDSRAVRRWAAPVEAVTHRDMPEASWVLLLILTGETTAEAVIAATQAADR